MTERTPLQEAMEALRPFAEFATAYDKFGIGEGHILDERIAVRANMRGIEVADLRRAAAAFDSLSTHLKGDNPDGKQE